jgi:BirA family biotin operon repressor/biotin-[acetyl-CoA-carboxylase] ligase
LSVPKHFQRRVALDEIRSLDFFQHVEWRETIDSTNKFLIHAIRNQSLAWPALIIADEQTAGVGRGSNQWWSPTGCLMFSMAIPLLARSGSSSHVGLQCTDPALLPLRVGCTIAECLDDIAKVPAMVKWPNDVYVGGKKISGVLIEVVATTSTAIAVIGMGINCQVEFDDAPQALANSATSLHQWMLPDQRELASPEHVLVSFLHRWLEWERSGCSEIDRLMQVWRQRSLLDHAWVEVKHSAGLARGRCLGIERNGALLIQNEQLEVIEVLAGTVVSYQVQEDRLRGL